jgi:hypothetical protein
MYKLKKVSFKDLKVLTVDEADFFFEDKTNEAYVQSLYTKIDAENPNV